MESAREILTDSCQSALTGAGFDRSKFMQLLPDPRLLNRKEKAAWIELRYWDDNAGLRKDHPAIEAFSQSRMQDLLGRLTADESHEVPIV